MDISDKIKALATKNNKSIQGLAEEIGMTKSGFYSTLNNNSFKVETLQKIADTFGVPIVYFFSKEAEKQDELIDFLMMDNVRKSMQVFSETNISWATVYGYLFEGVKQIVKEESNLTKSEMIDSIQKLLENSEEKMKERMKAIMTKDIGFELDD